MKPFITIKQLREKIEKKKCSPKEVLSYFIERFKTYDPKLKTALELFDEASIVKASSKKGTLHGIPGLIKDNIAQKDRSLTCASNILADFISPYDATAIERLKHEGAFLIGRANMDEFGMGSSTEYSAFFKTKNPWDMNRVPGGSSGGSAAAVAAGLVPWSLGSETGGSVRQPAAFCGVVGLKPTYGLVSRYGLVAYASSLDQIGVFAHTVYDTATVFSAIAGHDNRDSTSLAVKKKNYTIAIDNMPEQLTIGVIENALHAQGMQDEVIQAIEQACTVYEQLGAQIKRISLPSLDYAAAAYFIISRAEAASNLARYDGVRYGMRAKDIDNLKQMYVKTRSQGFGQEVKARIMIGNYVLSAGHADAFYENALKVQNVVRHDLSKAFQDVQLLLMPVHPAPAFTFGAFDTDKLQMDLQDYFTCAMNLSGNPALSIPCGFSKQQLPIGMQLVGPHAKEELIFQAAHAYEQQTPWHTMHPKGF